MYLNIETTDKETLEKDLIVITLGENDFLSKISMVDKDILYEINFRPEGNETRVWITTGTEINNGTDGITDISTSDTISDNESIAEKD